MIATTGVTFRSWPSGAFVELIELLIVLGAATLNRRWTLHDTEWSSGRRGTSELLRLDSVGEAASTLKLIDLVSDAVQLIGGELVGEDAAGRVPPLTIRSVRGDYWDVHTGDPVALATLRAQFHDVWDIPND